MAEERKGQHQQASPVTVARRTRSARVGTGRGAVSRLEADMAALPQDLFGTRRPSRPAGLNTSTSTRIEKMITSAQAAEIQ